MSKERPHKELVKVTFTVPGRLPTLTELIDSAKHNRQFYTRKKKRAQDRVALELRKQEKTLPALRSANFRYVFYEYKRTVDPSNLAFGAIKIIEDALRLFGVLSNDGWAHVLGIQIEWRHDPGLMSRVTVEIQGERDDRINPAGRRRDRELARLKHNKQKSIAQKARQAKKRAEHPRQPGKAVSSVAERSGEASGSELPDEPGDGSE